MLRHTYATNLINHEVDVKTAQELMRHSNFNTTLSLYTHVGEDHKKQVVNDVFGSTCVKNVLNLESENKQLSYKQIKKPLFKGSINYMAETVGFEPTDAFTSTDFESVSLQPLRYVSVTQSIL